MKLLRQCKNLCEKIRLLVLTIVNAFLPSKINDVSKGIKDCNKVLRQMREKLKKSSEVNIKRGITSCIAQVKGYKLQLMKLGSKRTSQKIKWVDIDSAFKSRIQTGAIINLLHKDPKKFLEDCISIFLRQMNSIMRNYDVNLKVNATFCGSFCRTTLDGEVYGINYVNTKNVDILKNVCNIKSLFKNNIISPIIRKLDELKTHESGWRLHSIIHLEVAINQHTHYRFSASSYVELPEQIKRKEACINVKNSDNACFAWAVVSALYPVQKDPQRISEYPHYSKVLNLRGIEFPVTVNKIPLFEKQNQISINVFTLSKKKNNFIVETCYITNEKKGKHINLLMIQDKYDYHNEEEVEYQYVWIKDISRLMFKQVNKSHQKEYFCERCLNYSQQKKLLEKHLEDCNEMNDSKIKMPRQDQNILKFKNYRYKEPSPFVIYADLECLLTPNENSQVYRKHVPCSIGYYVHCNYDQTLSFYNSYRGENCIEWFIKELQQFSEDVETVFLAPLPISEMTAKEKSQYYKAKICWMCNAPFKPDDKKHLDHCHLTGEVRGLAHEGCNINYKDDRIIPVVFHNMSGYDAHFIIKDIATKVNGNIDLLPVNKEKYISFTKHIKDSIIKFRFIDSFRFMNCSLAELANNLTDFPILREFIDRRGRMSDDEAYNYVHETKCSVSEDALRLITRKGVYPYDYFDSWERFSEPHLPSKEMFHNKLDEIPVSDEDYRHARKVWKKFHCKNLGEYSDLYLKTDVLILADVFEKFRETSRKAYDLDPFSLF